MVEFRDTPPRPPIANRTAHDLVEDLCLALRAVGVGSREAVAEALAIAAELDARGVSSVDRLNRLSEETSLVPGQCFGCHPCSWTKLLPMCPDRTQCRSNFALQRTGHSRCSPSGR